MRTTMAALAGIAACALATSAALAEPKTNMLHQWSEGSDAAAIAKLGDMFTAAGGKWEQTSIAGHTANTLAKLRADVVAGDAPPAVQLKGPEIAEWNATGMTANLDDLANKEGWDKVVAPELLPVMKPTGDWVAAPMNIHRINWIWGSTKAMEKAGITSLPKTWAEFNADCDKAVAAKLICLAHFSADWTDATTFEVVLYRNGPRPLQEGLRRRRHEGDALPEMVKALEQFRLMVSKYMDPAIAGRDYDKRPATDRQERGRLHDHGRLADRHFHGGRTQARRGLRVRPGADGLGQAGLHPQFGFRSSSSSRRIPTTSRARSCSRISSCRRNSRPCSIRPRVQFRRVMDVDLSQGFNACQQLSQKDLQASIAGGTLVRSMAHNMTILQKYRGAIMEVITTFVNTPGMSAKDAANAMADAVEAQK